MNSHILPEHDVRPYSVAQLADRWGCSGSMIYKLIKQGELQTANVGVLIRIAAAEVERFEGVPRTGVAESPKPERTVTAAPTRVDRIPDWPAMMTRKLAADYCSLSVAQFEREIIDGRLPCPVKLGGRDSWHRATIDKHLELIANPELDWRRDSPLYADDPRYQRK